MKNLLIALTITLAVLPLKAQQLSIEDIVDKIRQVDLFIKYGKFKDKVQSELTVLVANEKITAEEVE